MTAAVNVPAAADVESTPIERVVQQARRSAGPCVDRRLSRVAALMFALLAMSPALAAAQQHIALPPVNLGISSFMDAVSGPGLLLRENIGVYDAQRFRDAHGVTIAGQSSIFAFTSLSHIAYLFPEKVLCGYLGAEVLLPVVYVRLASPTGNLSTTGLGDVTFSPLVWQAPTLHLLGREVFQRLDMDIVAPTGDYSRNAPVTAGNNVWSVNPYYAVTWLATQRIETSWRLSYLWNSTNHAPGPGYDATSIQPGQAVHVNGAVSVVLLPGVRVGVAGYALRQVTDSRANGRAVPGSLEQVAALGPGLLASTKNTSLGVNSYWEFAAENRSEGVRMTAYLMRVW